MKAVYISPKTELCLMDCRYEDGLICTSPTFGGEGHPGENPLDGNIYEF